MKQIVNIFTILLLCNSVSFSQKFDTTSYYYQALKLHLDYLDTYNKTRPKEASLIYQYFMHHDSITDKFIPEYIGAYKIVKLTNQQIRSLTRYGSLHLVRIQPIYMKFGFMQIDINDINVQKTFLCMKFINIGGSFFQIDPLITDSSKLKIIYQGLKKEN